MTKIKTSILAHFTVCLYFLFVTDRIVWIEWIGGVYTIVFIVMVIRQMAKYEIKNEQIKREAREDLAMIRKFQKEKIKDESN